jgi:large subunit ribosomal protein L29
MKKKKGTDLKDLTVVELQDKLQDERGTLSKLRFSHTVSPIENPMQLRSKKKEVARILTELRKRELAPNTAKK